MEERIQFSVEFQQRIIFLMTDQTDIECQKISGELKTQNGDEEPRRQKQPQVSHQDFQSVELKAELSLMGLLSPYCQRELFSININNTLNE